MLLHSISFALLTSIAVEASSPIILFSDLFDDGQLSTNLNGVGGGFTSITPGSSGSASEAGGNLTFNVNGGVARALAVSNESFVLTGGFTLSFSYSISNGGNPSNTLNVALVDDATSDIDVILTENTPTDAFGFGVRPRNGVIVPGLLQVDAGSFNNNLDSTQTITDNASVVISVDENLNYSFSVNGATASTGTLSGFDLNQDYSIVLAAQGLTGATVSNITLQADCPDAIAGPSLALGSPFQDRMVLQRDKPINIWGTSEPNSEVTVNIADLSATGTTDSDGNWIIELPASIAGGPHVLDVTSTNTNGGSTTDTVNDVLYGDVWFCFGQSNMRWMLTQIATNLSWPDFYENEISSNDNIRCLRIGENASFTEDDDAIMAWLDNSTVTNWTAIGSVFAQQLHAATNVPVGIVWSAWGSSSIEGWMPAELSSNFPHFAEMLNTYQSINEFRDGIPTATRVPTDGNGVPLLTNEEHIANLIAGRNPSSLTGGFGSNNNDIFMRTRPNIIYNKMVHPMRNYGISGFIWYQGEANASNILDVAQYQFSLPRFVEEYRERFNQGDLPFLGVQLPSHNPINWHWFRESQDSLLTMPNTHIAITVDTGETNNVHPSDKEEIGVRLALQARRHALGENIIADSPRFESFSVNGNQITINFSNSTGLMTTNGGSPAGFEVAGSDGIFRDVTSSNIVGESIVVSSNLVSSPQSVRYAWTPVTHNTVNVVTPSTGVLGQGVAVGLPLAPFRTDSLPLSGLTAQAPFGLDDSFVALENQTLTIPPNGVLANDFDLNLNDLEVSLGSAPSNGSLILNNDGSFVYSPNIGFFGTDSFTYQTEETNGSLLSPLATVSIIVEEVPSVFEVWSNTIPWSPTDDRTPTGDPDQDGSNNFLEFAFGMNPLESDSTGLPVISPNGSDFELNFNNAQPGVNYEVLASSNLTDWTALTLLTSDSSTPLPLDTSLLESIVPDTIETSDPERLFLQIRVSEIGSE